MTRTVEYSRDAARVLLRIDRTTARRIREKVALLAKDPDALANNVTAMKGRPGLARLRVGDWRVIYTADFVVVLVLKIGARGDVYE